MPIKKSRKVLQVAVGTLLNDARRRRGHSYRDAGTEMGVSGQAVQNWERGAASPWEKNLPDLAKYLGMSTESLRPLWRAERKARLLAGIARRLP